MNDGCGPQKTRARPCRSAGRSGPARFTAGAARVLARRVFAAGVAQFGLLLVAAVRAGFALRPWRPRFDGRLRRLFAPVLPRAVGAGVSPLSPIVDSWFAPRLQEGAVSWLFQPDRSDRLPLGAVGPAPGTAPLPGLAQTLPAARRRAADPRRASAKPGVGRRARGGAAG